MDMSKTPHPDHSAQKARINRLRGQLDGVERMITDRRYCPDIVNQIRAVYSGLKALENKVIEAHMRMCGTQAFKSKDTDEAETKLQEVLDLLK